LLFVASLCSIGVVFGATATLLFLVEPPHGYAYAAFPLLFTLLCGFGAWAMYTIGVAASRRAENLEPLVPPTRQNIELMPVEETLVRASQEPTEGEGKVLLRAATATDETKPEELLRATTGRG